MLKEISCEIFAEKTITFHKGLNVVLGDNEGSNSIGKSTLLMIVDFVFGGNTYITHNKDVVIKLGNHEFNFTLEFNEEKLYFSRGTENSKVVYECNEKYEKIMDIPLEAYTANLKKFYEISAKEISFRDAVSLYSRVWGKGNYDVKKSFHTVGNESFLVAVARVIKLFNKYGEISKEDKELKKINNKKDLMRKAGNMDVIPKINKTIYKNNLKKISRLEEEKAELSKSIYSPAINISEIVSDEVLKLQEKKRLLLEQKNYYKGRLNRTLKTISNSINLNFESLQEFFPNVNVEKLEKIENFHEEISTILSSELKNARKDLNKRIDSLENEIQGINLEIEKALNPNEEPNIYVERLFEISYELKSLQMENNYYKNLEAVIEEIKEKSTSLNVTKERIVDDIEEVINSNLREIYIHIYSTLRTTPVLKLTPANYDYTYVDNTGTGNAYANIIVLDLAIFSLTELPFIIHDSFLFKNIEKPAIEKLINYYSSSKKQIFIAFDVIDIYDQKTQVLLKENKVIQLSKENILFTLDWKDEKK